MSLLLDPLPACVTVEGKEYPIVTDWRAWARLTVQLADPQQSVARQAVALLSMYPSALPPTEAQAIEAAAGFYATGRETGKREKKEEHKAILSFAHDGDDIFAAFLAEYGIDLTVSDMHWYKFMALFRALGEENQIVKIMQYRSVDLSRIKDMDLRAMYRKMKRLYALPDMRSQEQKEADMLHMMEQLF